MATIADAYVAIRADTKGFADDTTKAVGGLRGAVGAIGATVGTVALGSLFVSATRDAQDAERATAKLGTMIASLESPIASTAGEIAKWATALQRKTAIDDDSIKAGTAQLLTFQRMREGIGSTDAGLKRVMDTTAGLAKFWDKDFASASVMVGKALDSPVEGLTALGRVGIKFSADQVKVIKSLVDTGQTAKAQEMILAELGKQGGDAGLKMATGSEKAAAAAAEAKESIGNALVPALNALAKVITPVANAFASLPGPLQAIAVAGLGVAVLAPRISATVQAFGLIGPAAAKMGPSVAAGASKMAPAVMGAMKGIGPAISGGFAALAPLLGAAMPWILIVAGIALAAVAIFAFFKSDLPKKIWEALKDAGSWLLEAGGKILKGLWDGVIMKAVDIWLFFNVELPKKILGFFVDAAQWLLEAGSNILKGLWDGVLSKVVDIALFFGVELPKKILGFFSDAGKWLLDAGKDIIMGLARGLGDAVEWVLAAARAVVDKVKGVLMFWSSPPEAFGRKLGAGLMGGLADGMNTGADASARAAAAAVARTRAAMAMAATPVNLSAAVRGAIGGAGAGGAAPTTVNLDLRGATVGVDDLVDQVAAGLAKRDRRTGAALT